MSKTVYLASNHNHSVIDKDAFFTVDAIKRIITNTDPNKNLIVQGDHNSERFTFKIPRYIEGHDMLAANHVTIPFLNTETSGKNKDRKYVKDVYMVGDLDVSAEDKNYLTCSWLISKSATHYAGDLNFQLVLSCMTGSAIDYRWKTDIFSGIHVIESLDSDLVFEAENRDVIEQWKVDLFNELTDYIDNGIKTQIDVAQIDKNKNDILTLARDVATENAALSTAIATQTSRINNLMALPEGSTTNDAELDDIRVGVGGVVYPNGGEAVRAQIGDLTDYAEYIGHVVKYDSGRTYRGSVEIAANKEVPATNSIVRASILKGTEYDVTFAYGTEDIPTVSIYERYADGTHYRLRSGMVPGTVYSFVANGDVIGISAYIDRAAVIEDSSITLVVTTHEYNEGSIETRLAEVERYDKIFENRVLTNADIELGAIQDGTGMDVVNETGNRKRTKTFIPMWAGSHVKCPTKVNVWEYDHVTHEYICDNGAWTDDYVVKNDCDIRIMWMVAGDEDLLANTEIEYAKQIREFSLPTIEVPICEFMPSMTVKSISHRGRYGNGIGAMCCKSAMIAARMQGYRYIENDVNVTRDGQLVMWHDSDLARVGDPYHKISDYTLAELKNIDFGSYAGFPGEQIMTFAEWVLCAKELGMDIYVDFKITATDAQAEEMVRTVRRYGMLKNTSWLGNHALICKYDPHARLGVLSNPNAYDVENYKKYRDGGEVFFNGPANELSAEAAMLALDNGFGLEAWLVDFEGVQTKEQTFKEIERLVALGVQGLTLDIYRVEDAINAKYNLI